MGRRAGRTSPGPQGGRSGCVARRGQPSGWRGTLYATGNVAWPVSIASASDFRTVTASTTPAAATIAAPTAKATWNPLTVADVFSATVVIPPLSRWLVRDAASVESTASPSAPPTCWDVLRIPEARPASDGATFVVASRVQGTNVRPIPVETIRIVGRMSLAYVPSTGSRAK